MPYGLPYAFLYRKSTVHTISKNSAERQKKKLSGTLPKSEVKKKYSLSKKYFRWAVISRSSVFMMT